LSQQLDRQLKGGERDGLLRELHTLKGVAATVGVMALATLAGEAEVQLASQPADAEAARCIARVGAAIDAAAASLASLCDALDADQDATDAGAVASVLTAADTAQLASLLRTLQGLLQAFDLDATGAMRTVRARLPTAAGPRLDALETAVESLEFESALSQCDEWLLECDA
jgi:HPt (histidine-containing phosphotransfer) domain-containing protein